MAAVTAKARMSGLLRNAIALMFSTVASAALGMVFWAVAARMYDTAALGRASAAASAITLLGGLAQLSLTTAFVRFVPTLGSATRRFIGRGYAASSLAAVVLATGFAMCGLGRSFLAHGILPFLGFCLAVLCTAFSALQDGVLTAMRRTSWVPVENIAIAVAKLALLPIMGAAATGEPVLFAWAIPVIVATGVVSWLIFGRLVPAAVRSSRGRSRMPKRQELTSFMTAEYLNGLLGNLIGFLPPVLVALVLGPEQNAVFYLPWLIGTAIFALLWNIAISFMVEATSDPAHTRAHLRHSLRLGLLVTVGGGAVLLIGAPLVLPVAGSAYSSGGTTALRLIALTLPLEGICTLFAAGMLMEKKAWSIFWLRTVDTSLFLATAVPAMHRWGTTGAAGAFLVAEIVAALLVTPRVVRQYRRLANRTIDDDVTQVISVAEILATVPAGPGTRSDRAGRPARGVAMVPGIGLGSGLDGVPLIFVPERPRWFQRPPDNTMVIPRVVDHAADGAETTVLTRLADAERTAVLSRVDAQRAAVVPRQADAERTAVVPRQADAERTAVVPRQADAEQTIVMSGLTDPEQTAVIPPVTAPAVEHGSR